MGTPPFSSVRRSLFVCFLVILFSMVLNDGFCQKAKQSEKLKQSRTKLEDEIRYTGEMLEKTKKEKQSSMDRLKILNKQIRNRERLLQTIGDEMQQVEVQLTYESQQIGKMSQQLVTLRTEYAQMIRQAYRTMSGHDRLMFLFSSKDFNQAYQRLKYYQQFAAYRRDQALKIEATRRGLDQHVRELENTRIAKQELLGAQSREKQRLDSEKKEKDQAVKLYTTKEKELLATLKKKQQAALKLNSEIEKAINAEITAAQSRSQKKPVTPGTKPKPGIKVPPKETINSPVPELSPGDRLVSTSFSANRGKLPWPCERGLISESFGEHPHPVLKHVKVKNNGIDILTDQGASIRAVFNGKVTKVMSFQYLNKVIIVRHGEYLTVYSNLGEVNVKEGDEVKARQVIGKIQSSADNQRPELHFELWKGKTILNPELWLANR
jgi:septal ring factor EnvC (AmiA/AmiB activator)